MTPLRLLPPVLSLACLVAFWACGSGEEAETVRSGAEWRVSPLALPALAGGGMPHLSPLEDGGVLLSWLAPRSESAAGDADPTTNPEADGSSGALSELRVVRFEDGTGFGEPRLVVRRDDFFVNWADFPSVVEVGPDRWVAHWLQRGDAGGYDYEVRMAATEDEGVSWSGPWTLHEDRSPTEHGFVTVWAAGEGRLAAVWLDGRKYVDGAHGPATEEMTLRAREMDARGRMGVEHELDSRTCDCCQTDVALTEGGPVVVYRDRSPEEVRDIHVVRWEDGAWSTPRPVHRDGWVIPGCPVNGPAIDARADRVAVAWFAAPRDEPRVQLAFSQDGGATFQPPVRIDDGRPLGRTDVVLTEDGSAVVLWLEETGNGVGELRLRRVYRDGSAGPAHLLATTLAARASGFPQLLRLGDAGLFAAWTEASTEGPVAVRVARMELPR